MKKSKKSPSLPDDTPQWIKDAIGKDRFISTVITEFNQLQREASEMETYLLKQKAEWLRDRDRLLQVQNEYMFFLGVSHGVAEIIFKELAVGTLLTGDGLERVRKAGERLQTMSRRHAETLSKEPNYCPVPTPE